MKYLKTLSLIAVTMSLTACGGIKSQDEIAQLSPTEVAQLGCNAFKSLELEQLKLIISERMYKKLEEKTDDELFRAKASRLDCEVTEVTQARFRKQQGMIVSFVKGRDIKVFKVDGKYQIDM